MQKALTTASVSVLGYRRNMAVQHRRLCGRGPASSADIKGSFFDMETTTVLVSSDNTLMKT